MAGQSCRPARTGRSTTLGSWSGHAPEADLQPSSGAGLGRPPNGRKPAARDGIRQHLAGISRAGCPRQWVCPLCRQPQARLPVGGWRQNAGARPAPCDRPYGNRAPVQHPLWAGRPTAHDTDRRPPETSPLPRTGPDVRGNGGTGCRLDGGPTGPFEVHPEETHVASTRPEDHPTIFMQHLALEPVPRIPANPHYSRPRRPQRATTASAGTSLARPTSKPKHRVCHAESRLPCSGNTLCDLVPAYVKNPG